MGAPGASGYGYGRNAKCLHQLTPVEAGVLAIAGVAAGAINTVVGSGSLVTFPVLLALGYSPIHANVSNNVGLTPGSISGTIGYRRELTNQHRRILALGAFSFAGAIAGAALLLVLPASAFNSIAPIVVAVPLALVLLQPRLESALAHHRRPDGSGGLVLCGVVGLAGAYGAYFGAALGVLLIAVLGIAIDDGLQRLNALKNLLGALVNATSATVFVFLADVDWTVAALLGVGSTVGGLTAAHFGRRLPAEILRAVIVLVGIFALVQLLIR